MPGPATPRRVVVVGADAGAVGREVARRRGAGERAAGFVGGDDGDQELARILAEEMLGGLDELVVLGEGPGPAPED